MRQTLTQIKAFAWCPQVMCPGNAPQVEVDATAELVQWTYGDNGCDEMYLKDIVERSHEALSFANPDDVACPHCKTTRALSRQERPVYEGLSGYAQDALVRLKQLGYQFRWDQGKRAANAAAADGKETPEDRLKYLFVEGKISAEEYEERRRVLAGIFDTEPAKPKRKVASDG